ncbi:hypothetical protein [Echinicola strongylocentroti]|uniref:hypothetical protein n=1 Tax=Echinicola strongylocentroti TaxID=1795355 RepID=UPI001B85E772|nr:hypothetical protein [Echinicola strongylocentroti]
MDIVNVEKYDYFCSPFSQGNYEINKITHWFFGVAYYIGDSDDVVGAIRQAGMGTFQCLANHHFLLWCNVGKRTAYSIFVKTIERKFCSNTYGRNNN